MSGFIGAATGGLGRLIGGMNPQMVTAAQQALGMAAGPLGQFNIPLTAVLRMGRSIGVIIPDVTIEETHEDRLEVTVHPIANNSPISDHAFKHPATVTMRCGWSNSNVIGGMIESAAGALTSAFSPGGLKWDSLSNPFNSVTETRARDIYARLVALQESRTWFTLTTGKRRYNSMVITGLSVMTDRHSEYALMVTVHMQEVLLVDTATETIPAANQQALAPTTNPVTEGGTEQRRSMLDRIREGVGIKDTPGGWMPNWFRPPG